MGVYCFRAQALFEALKKVRMNPGKKEYYLTDVIELLLARGESVSTLTSQDSWSLSGSTPARIWPMPRRLSGKGP